MCVHSPPSLWVWYTYVHLCKQVLVCRLIGGYGGQRLKSIIVLSHSSLSVWDSLSLNCSSVTQLADSPVNFRICLSQPSQFWEYSLHTRPMFDKGAEDLNSSPYTSMTSAFLSLLLSTAWAPLYSPSFQVTTSSCCHLSFPCSLWMFKNSHSTQYEVFLLDHLLVFRKTLTSIGSHREHTPGIRVPFEMRHKTWDNKLLEK